MCKITVFLQAFQWPGGPLSEFPTLEFPCGASSSLGCLCFLYPDLSSLPSFPFCRVIFYCLFPYLSLIFLVVTVILV